MAWRYFLGNISEPTPLEDLPEQPPWRSFFPKDQVEDSLDRQYWASLRGLAGADLRAMKRGQCFRVPESDEGIDIIDAVNAAIHLRRPLLITGAPGSGKTSLAYAIAYQLQLGPVLTWPITAKSNLTDALYRYDAIARLQDAQLDKSRPPLNPEDPTDSQSTGQPENQKQEGGLGDYLQLGAVGTAFIPSKLPRVLLIDEIDKSDLNLPNDLLNLFEEGEFEIPELVRRKRIYGNDDEQSQTVKVRTADKGLDTLITNGLVQCCEFPIVIMTSNGERDFPPAFYRRCLRVKMPNPTQSSLLPIVESHFNELDPTGWLTAERNLEELLDQFLEKGKKADRSTDQLLNAIYILTRGEDLTQEEQKRLTNLLFKRLSEPDA